MSKLRYATEHVLQVLREYNEDGPMARAFESEVMRLESALAQEALDRITAENQRLGLYDDHILWQDLDRHHVHSLYLAQRACTNLDDFLQIVDTVQAHLRQLNTAEPIRQTQKDPCGND